MGWYESAMVPPGFAWPGEVGLLGLAIVTLLACGALLLLAVQASRWKPRSRGGQLRVVRRRDDALALGR